MGSGIFWKVCTSLLLTADPPRQTALRGHINIAAAAPASAAEAAAATVAQTGAMDRSSSGRGRVRCQFRSRIAKGYPRTLRRIHESLIGRAGAARKH